ncbi:MAG: Methionine-tRNA ligase [Candidatus Azambacteria bacterium GW2011_GWE1_42_9]|uniref:Methionine--tRNA ligase n=1 Tax=Candidatus Zambryskibacteria bacterium RIFOXYD2_FULL_43_10 TaxID=1802782 RepID=A0A1G2V8R1_9BACT|nr:MAG: Methionine-tRNA ligase [Candidatus Azambacteria bacterium GW2011_GWE1_42_9]OHB17975.1 MAG: methionine--tRNA ligase [Candidatus Zambryskibacteria bacterium RIFOXYD2_FULL_43_10]
MKSFYITTTLPYVNAEPHIGFAMELVHADIIARWKQLNGFDVFFNTGTDEHGLKIYQAALIENKTPQAYTDELAQKFKNLQLLLGLSDDLHFIRTTDEHHKKAAQEFWKLCKNAGDIYKKEYKIRYCVGCELEKTDSGLADGRCPIHPNKELEMIEEENYFFRLSKYGPKLLEFYDKNPDFVIPDFRLNEMRALIGRGLEDFSISRLKSKMPWGIDVPGDSNHVQYVWFDALVNYISTIGWPDDMDKFNKYWPVVQFAGKDQVRQQVVMWQAMLMSAGLLPSKQIVIHGFINYEGQKMSKSLGNVISPQEVIDEYGVDALRYFVAREFNQFEDMDISREKLRSAYNANLANGLGNLVSRVMTMAEAHLKSPVTISEWEDMSEFFAILDKFEINKATNYIWAKIGELDALIQKEKPWESKDTKVITNLVAKLYSIARMLNPIMPETSNKIKELVQANKKPSEPLFLRKDA